MKFEICVRYVYCFFQNSVLETCLNSSNMRQWTRCFSYENKKLHVHVQITNSCSFLFVNSKE